MASQWDYYYKSKRTKRILCFYKSERSDLSTKAFTSDSCSVFSFLALLGLLFSLHLFLLHKSRIVILMPLIPARLFLPLRLLGNTRNINYVW